MQDSFEFRKEKQKRCLTPIKARQPCYYHHSKVFFRLNYKRYMAFINNRKSFRRNVFEERLPAPF